MPRLGYDASVVDVAGSIIKAAAAIALLFGVGYVLHDVYSHTAAIHVECQHRIDLEIVQARDLLTHFCVLHPNDEGGKCQDAQRKISVRDRDHAVRDCRIDHLTDTPIVREIFTLSLKGVCIMVVALVVLVWIIRLVAVTLGELKRVSIDYRTSATIGLPTVVPSTDRSGATKAKAA